MDASQPAASSSVGRAKRNSKLYFHHVRKEKRVSGGGVDAVDLNLLDVVVVVYVFECRQQRRNLRKMMMML
jgi:hypothetical protein